VASIFELAAIADSVGNDLAEVALLVEEVLLEDELPPPPQANKKAESTPIKVRLLRILTRRLFIEFNNILYLTPLALYSLKIAKYIPHPFDLKH
jgi:hypothetical protein